MKHYENYLANEVDAGPTEDDWYEAARQHPLAYVAWDRHENPVIEIEEGPTFRDLGEYQDWLEGQPRYEIPGFGDVKAALDRLAIR